MENINLANAYTEAVVIINNLKKEDYDKIPISYINYLEENCNPNYEFKYDISKRFSQQKVLDETKSVMFYLFEKFGATDKQKQIVENYKKLYYQKIEEEKKKIYDPNDIFKQSNKSTIENIVENSSNDNKIIIYNEQQNIFSKIIKKIKLFFLHNYNKF